MRIEINSYKDILRLLEDHPELPVVAYVKIIRAYAGDRTVIVPIGIDGEVETERSRAKAHKTLREWLKEHGEKLDNDPNTLLPGLFVMSTDSAPKTSEK